MTIDIAAPELPRTLTSYLDEIIKSGVHTTPEIAAQALRDVPREVLDACLLRFLTDAARSRLGDWRHANGTISGKAALRRVHPGFTGGSVDSADSGKVAAIRAAEQERIAVLNRDTLWVGNRRITLGEASFADLMRVAATYRAQAGALSARADRIERIAEAVKSHKVARVDQLPLKVALAFADGG